MFDQIKRLFRHSVVYGLGDMGGRIVSFLLLPIVLRYLTPEDYGTLEIFQVIKNLCLALLPIGLASSIFRYYFKASTSSERIRIVSNAFFVLLFIALGVFLFGSLAREWISLSLWNTTDLSLHVMVVSGTIALEILKVVPFALLRARERSFFFAAIQILNILGSLTLNIVFLVVFKLGILAILLGNLLGTCLVFGPLFPIFFENIRPRISLREILILLRYGAPVAVGSITFLLINSMDRFFIKHYCSMDELGIYALGFRFVSLLTMFLVNPFNYAWLPFALSIEKNENAKDVYAAVLTYFLFIGLFMLLTISLFTAEIIRLISPVSYWGDYHFVIVLGFAYLFFGIFNNVKIGISIREKTQYFMISSLCALAVNGILNVLLVPRFHLMGAAFSNLGAYLILFGVTLFFSQKMYLIVYEYGRIVKQFAVFLLVMLLVFLIHPEGTALRVGMKAGFLILFPVLLYLTGFFTKSEIQRVKSIVRYRTSS